jgi:NAD-dependent dihydropyrimidine dehydrogenase PreA subunit
MAVRKIVKIDEEKCTGCGDCITACAEGALQIIGGKARIVKEIYCDGLGACLGTCPEDAITIEEREAPDFDEEATREHLDRAKERKEKETPKDSFQGCPGAKMMAGFNKSSAVGRPEDGAADVPSELANWPVQLMLAPVRAPFFENADLLLSADCVPFAYANFHGTFLRGKPLLMGCPKLDDAHVYVEKLAQIITQNELGSIRVVHMEVPCCTGLVHILERALEISGKNVPVKDITISISGEIKEEKELDTERAA